MAACALSPPYNSTRRRWPRPGASDKKFSSVFGWSAVHCAVGGAASEQSTSGLVAVPRRLSVGRRALNLSSICASSVAARRRAISSHQHRHLVMVLFHVCRLRRRGTAASAGRSKNISAHRLINRTGPRIIFGLQTAATKLRPILTSYGGKPNNTLQPSRLRVAFCCCDKHLTMAGRAKLRCRRRRRELVESAATSGVRFRSDSES